MRKSISTTLSSAARTDTARVEFTAREAAWLAAGSVLFALAFLYPMLCPLGYLGPGLAGWLNRPPVLGHLLRFPANGDWDNFTQLRWAAWHTATHFHQAPLWNPYKCGGMTLLGNPESAALTPFFLFDLLAGPALGTYLQIFLHLALGFAGGYVLARTMALGRVAGVVLSSVFLSCSWIYLQLSMGNLNLALPIAYWPWIVAMFFRSLERRKLVPAVIGGALLALTLTEGNYAFLYAVMMLGPLAVMLSAVRRSAWPAAALMVLVAMALGFAAPKLIPVTEMLWAYPRPLVEPEPDTLSRMPTFLFSRNQDLYRDIPGLLLYAAYGAYVSIPFAALAALGLATGRLKALVWVPAAIIFAAVARGNSGPWCALALLRMLPLCHNIAFPSRFIFPFVFTIAVFAALGADFVCRGMGRHGCSAVLGLLALGLLDSWAVGTPNLRYLFHNPIPSFPAQPEFRQFWMDSTAYMTEMSEANLGAIHCWGYGISIPTRVSGSNQPSYRGEYQASADAEVRQLSWSPNRVRFEVAAKSRARLVINQNYFPGWRVAGGDGEVYSEGGLLAVRLPPGRQVVVLRFVPSGLGLGLSLTGAALLLAIGLWKEDL